MPSPWSIKGIPQEARAAAKAAAQRQGMTLGAWIVSKIEEESAEALSLPEGSAPAPSIQTAPPARASATAANALALQSLTQILAQQRAETENQAVAALSARIDSLAQITESLTSSVATCLQRAEAAEEKARLAEAHSLAANSEAETARGEAAVSLRASAAVAKKTIAALGGVENPGEDIKRELEEAFDDRLGVIESRILDGEAANAERLDAVSASVQRTEALLEALSEKLEAQAAAPSAGETSPPVTEHAIETVQNDPAFDIDFTSVADGELTEVGAVERRVEVDPIDAPGLRNRIRSRLHAQEFVDENLRAAHEDAPQAFNAEEADSALPSQQETSQQESADLAPERETKEGARRRGLGFGGWFSRSAHEEDTAASPEMARAEEGLEPFLEQGPSDFAEKQAPDDFASSFAASPEESAENPHDDGPWLVPHDAAISHGVADDLTDDSHAPQSAPMSPPSQAPAMDQDAASAFREEVYELVDTLEPPAIDPAGLQPDQAGQAWEEGFDDALERVRRQRELAQAEEEAEAVDLVSHSLRRDAATRRQAESADQAADEEPLTLGPSQEVPAEPSGELDDREPVFWGNLPSDGPDPYAEEQKTPRAQAESAGSQSAHRSVIASDAWPFEADDALAEANERALEDESGSVRYGVALSLALMGLTAGAAMAALYQLGA